MNVCTVVVRVSTRQLRITIWDQAGRRHQAPFALVMKKQPTSMPSAMGE